MALEQYDPGNTVLIVGVIPLGGFADGVFISAERDEDTWNKFAGRGGEAVRVRNRNALGRVTATLQQTSLTNALLSALAELDERTGLGIGPLWGQDLGGADVIASPECWIAKPPAMAFAAKELSNREWMIDCSQLRLFAGGSLI